MMIKKQILSFYILITFVLVMASVQPAEAAETALGTISGYVRDQNGNPIANVFVVSHDGTTFTSTHSAANGSYTLTSVPVNSHHLQASLAGYAISHYWGFVVTSGGNYQNINFTLRPGGGTISGRVVGSYGEGIPNASINIWENTTNGFNNGAWASTTADANGYYQTSATNAPGEGLPTGNYLVQATYNGANQTVDHISVTSGSNTANANISFITGTTAGTSTIRGYVRDENGNAIPGASISSHDGTTFRNATTDSSGAYTLIAVPANPSHLMASIAGKAYSHYWGFNVDPNMTYNNINFTLRPGGGTISGRVTDSKGAGKPNVTINVWQKTDLVYGNGTWATTTTNADGYYQTSATDAPGPGLPTGTYFVQASSGTTVSRDNVQVNAGNNTANVNMGFVTGAGSISGRVTQEGTGLGISGATVYIDNGVVQLSTATDANGYYLGTGLPDGAYNVVMVKNGYASAHRYNITIANAGITSNVDFVMTTDDSTISGYVTDQYGNPLVGAQILADSDQGTGYGTTVTGLDGHYVLTDLAPMLYYVHVSFPGYAAQMQLAATTKNMTTANIDFVLGTASGVITGQITKDGTPAEYTTIYVNSSAGASSVYYGNTVADANGNYTINNLVPGEYDVHVYGVAGYGNQVKFYIPVSQGQTNVNFNLLKGATTIRGRVTDPYGNPISNANIQPFNNANPGTWASVFTDSNGYYTADNLFSGLYTIYANKAGYENVVKYYQLMPDGTNTVNFVMGLTRALQPELNKVSVMVKDNFGTYRSVLVQVTSGLEASWSASSDVDWLLLGNSGHLHSQSGNAGDGLILRFDPTMVDYGTWTTNLVLNSPDAASSTIQITIIKLQKENYHQLFLPGMRR